MSLPIPAPDEELLQEQPDLFSRHYRVFLGVNRLRAQGLLPNRLSVLDVGGSTGLARRFFPSDEVTVADVAAGSATDVVLEPGAALPFADGQFDLVLSCDSLEHVAPPDRQLFVAECARVAQSLVVLTFPDGRPDVVRQETAVREAVHAAFADPHQWLDEHEQRGLPTCDEVVAWGAVTELEWSFRSSFPLESWAPRLLASFAYANMRDRRTMHPLVRSWNERSMRWDESEPGYRCIAIGSNTSLGGATLVSQAFAAGSENASAATLEQQVAELLALDALVADLEIERTRYQRAYEDEAEKYIALTCRPLSTLWRLARQRTTARSS